MSDLRRNRPWSEAPKWAKVKLVNVNNPQEFVFAESVNHDARAWPSTLAPYADFKLHAPSWLVVDTRPEGLTDVGEYKEGAKAVVVDSGQAYTTHRQAFKSTGLDISKWRSGYTLSPTTDVTVVGVLNSNKSICVVDYDGKYYLTGLGGIKVLEEPKKIKPSAVNILQEGIDCIGDRASERDTDSERSMLKAIKAFNEMFGTELTEEQGWQFMTLLKMSRSQGGNYRRDDYVDGAAYFALAGEASGAK